jgi:hypothetical protein
LEGLAPFDITEIGWPSGSVDAGRKESGVDKIEVVCGKGEWAIQVIDLVANTLATVLQEVPLLNKAIIFIEQAA